jgi:hypothetical protein
MQKTGTHSKFGSSELREILTGGSQGFFICTHRGVSRISAPAPSFGAKCGLKMVILGLSKRMVT